MDFEAPNYYTFIDVNRSLDLAQKLLSEIFAPRVAYLSDDAGTYASSQPPYGEEQFRVDTIITTPIASWEFVKSMTKARKKEAMSNILITVPDEELVKTFMAKLMLMYPNSAFSQDPVNTLLPWDLIDYTDGRKQVLDWFVAAADLEAKAMLLAAG